MDSLERRLDSEFMNHSERVVEYGKRLLPQVIDESAEENPHRLVGMMAKSHDISDGFIKVTIGDVANAVNHMAWWIEECVGKSKDFETVAYLGVNDLRYWIVVFSGIKCGKKILLPSIRNSPANNLSLLESTQCKNVFCASPLDSIAIDLRDKLDLNVFVIPSWDQMLGQEARPYEYKKTWEHAHKNPIIVLHTSGSTGNPKPIIYNHAFMGYFDSMRLVPSANGLQPANMGSLPVGADECFYLCFPLFHLVGLAYSLYPLLYTGVVVLGPSQVIQNSGIASAIIRKISFKALVMPPSLLEDIVKDYGEDFKRNVSTVKLISYGGGPLAHATGDYLAKFVPGIAQIYGQTEIAMPQILLSAPEDSRYFQFHPTHSGVTLEPTGDEENHHELVINRDPKMCWCQPVFENFPDLESWRTKDLFQRHPTRADLWLFKGRRDDVIVLSNAEKFNPVLMEGMILGHPAVKGALVVGTGKFQCGLIVEPQSQGYYRSIVEEIWPVVEKANEQSPGYAQIDRRLIIVSKQNKPFHRAGKGTVMRYATTTSYAEEIEEMYRSYQLPVLGNAMRLEDPNDFSAIKSFVQQILEKFLGVCSINEEQDFFQAGLDSLKTSQIANYLQVSLGPHLKPEGIFSSRIVYENPDIHRLSDALYNLLNNSPATNGHNGRRASQREQLMKSLVEKYSSNLPTIPKKLSQRITGDKINVILTGSTGSLGYHILGCLLRDTKIGKIYCLDRSLEAQKRFERKSKIVNGDSDNGSANKVVWMKVDLADPSFGLPHDMYDHLLENIDVIIHNAWKVDFNHTLTSFIPQIAGVHNLASFSRKSPHQPHLFLISSISAVGDWNSPQPIPEIVPVDYNVASRMGYGESKYVGERMLHEIASASPKKTNFNILRIGQIAGPEKDLRGIWNKNEWFPSLLLTSKELKKLPRTLGRFEMIDWIPVDALADIILDLVHDACDGESKTAVGESEGVKVFNLVNSKRSPFLSFVEGIREKLGAGVEIVEYEEWVSAVEEIEQGDEQALERLPALKILGFFEGLKMDKGEDCIKFDTKNGMQSSPSMRNLPTITGELIKRWMSQWGL